MVGDKVEVPSGGSSAAQGDDITAAQVRMLAADNGRMRAAGCELAAAAMCVVGEYDGLHRLALAVAGWASAVAGEGGREARHDGRN